MIGDETRDPAPDRDIAARDVREPVVAGHDGPIRSAIRGRCPRCGQGALFQGFLRVRPRCEVCGLDYSTIQTGDGPASFIMQVAGFIVGFSALAVEIRFHPPIWLHLIIWVPMVIALSLALMRPGRGLMIGLQYRNQTDRTAGQDR